MGEAIQQCAECVALLGDYLDGLLAKERAEALETHLSRCMPCVTFVRTYKKTTVIARETLAADMPPELGKALKSFLKGKINGFACDESKGNCGDAAAKLAAEKDLNKS